MAAANPDYFINFSQPSDSYHTYKGFADSFVIVTVLVEWNYY